MRQRIRFWFQLRVTFHHGWSWLNRSVLGCSRFLSWPSRSSREELFLESSFGNFLLDCFIVQEHDGVLHACFDLVVVAELLSSCVMASTAFAVLDSLEIEQFSGAILSVEVGRLTQLDLGINALVVAMVPHRAGNLEQRDCNQAEGAQSCEHWIGVRAHHLPCCQCLPVVIAH